MLGLILLVGTACSTRNSNQIASTPLGYPVEPNETALPDLPTNTPEHDALESIDEPVDNANPILGEHQWVLSRISLRGEDKEIGALHPAYFNFDLERNLLLVTTPCEGTDDQLIGYGFDIEFQEKQHYILFPQDTIMPGCGEMIETQTEHLRVIDTARYEIQNDQLLLIGDNIQITLELADTNS